MSTADRGERTIIALFETAKKKKKVIIGIRTAGIYITFFLKPFLVGLIFEGRGLLGFSVNPWFYEKREDDWL